MYRNYDSHTLKKLKSNFRRLTSRMISKYCTPEREYKFLNLQMPLHTAIKFYMYYFYSEDINIRTEILYDTTMVKYFDKYNIFPNNIINDLNDTINAFNDDIDEDDCINYDAIYNLQVKIDFYNLISDIFHHLNQNPYSSMYLNMLHHCKTFKGHIYSTMSEEEEYIFDEQIEYLDGFVPFETRDEILTAIANNCIEDIDIEEKITDIADTYYNDGYEDIWITSVKQNNSLVKFSVASLQRILDLIDGSQTLADVYIDNRKGRNNIIMGLPQSMLELTILPSVFIGIAILGITNKGWCWILEKGNI